MTNFLDRIEQLTIRIRNEMGIGKADHIKLREFVEQAVEIGIKVGRGEFQDLDMGIGRHRPNDPNREEIEYDADNPPSHRGDL